MNFVYSVLYSSSAVNIPTLQPQV